MSTENINKEHNNQEGALDQNVLDCLTSEIEKASDDATIEALLDRTEHQPVEDEDKQEAQEEEKRVAEEFRQVIKEKAREDEAPASRHFTLSKILGGDILSTQAIRSQVGLILLIVGFTIVYVSNRYSCQQKQIQIEKLTKEVQNSKYKALSISSELTELSRQSNVLEKLNANNDSLLKMASEPPFIVNVDK